MTNTLQQLFDLGLHFGHLKSYSHPKSKPYVFKVVDGVCVIDLEKTSEGLKEALSYIKKLAKENKTILFIGTKRQASSFIKEAAEKISMPYINKRFMGGTLTNFETVLKNIEKYQDLEEKAKEENLTKKEERQIIEEKERLKEAIGGLLGLKELPDALFIVDVVKEKNAVLEGNRLEIPMVAIVDTNGDSSKIDYPIPANDDAKEGVEFIVEEAAKAYLEGKGKAKKRKNAQD